MTSNVVRGTGHHREHQLRENVGTRMKSRCGGIPYGLQARKAPNWVPFLRSDRHGKLAFRGREERKKRPPPSAAVPFAAWVTSLPSGFTDRREVIPSLTKKAPRRVPFVELIEYGLTRWFRLECGPSTSKRCRPKEALRVCRGRWPQSSWCPPSIPSSQAWTE